MGLLFERTVSSVERQLDGDYVPSVAIIFGSFVCKALTFGEIGNIFQVHSPKIFTELERRAALLDFTENRIFDAPEDMFESYAHLNSLHKTLSMSEDVLSSLEKPPFEYQVALRAACAQIETAARHLIKKAYKEELYKSENMQPPHFDEHENPHQPAINYITPRLVPVFQKAAMWLAGETVRHYVTDDIKPSRLKIAREKIEKLKDMSSELSIAAQDRDRVADEKQVFGDVYRLCDYMEGMERMMKDEKLSDIRHFFQAVNSWSSMFLYHPSDDIDINDNNKVIDLKIRQPRPNNGLRLVSATP